MSIETLLAAAYPMPVKTPSITTGMAIDTMVEPDLFFKCIRNKFHQPNK